MKNKHIFKIVPKGNLKINKDIFNDMMSYAQATSLLLESGGILIGRRLIGCEDIIIDFITTPMKNDIRRRCFYKKALRDHQNMLEEIWMENDKVANYLGEWHTHPENIPNPSNHDIIQWRKILSEIKGIEGKIFFVIIGIEKIRIWQGIVGSNHIEEIYKK